MADHKSASVTLPWLAILPLFVFLGLAGIFYSLLSKEGRDAAVLPSALLDEPAPVLIVPELRGLFKNGNQIPGFDADTLRGKLSVVNVFASWCVPCRHEHPQILKLAGIEGVQMVGLNHRDQRSNALAFLEELGNPYDVVGVDRRGRASIEWGVYGVPETFLVDETGTVFYKHTGPISERQLDEILMPLLKQKLVDAG